MITIDGSYGEGGGQILRTALALSLVTGKPFSIRNIRAGRKKPGLMRQHLTAVNAAAEIGLAAIEGNSIGSKAFTFAPEKEKEYLDCLVDNNQIIFKYAKPNGDLADHEYPWNPNGSLSDIAGICNPKGNVMGMMPHPERVMHPYLHHNWTRSPGILNRAGDGRVIFECLIDYIKKKF